MKEEIKRLLREAYQQDSEESLQMLSRELLRQGYGSEWSYRFTRVSHKNKVLGLCPESLLSSDRFCRRTQEQLQELHLPRWRPPKIEPVVFCSHNYRTYNNVSYGEIRVQWLTHTYSLNREDHLDRIGLFMKGPYDFLRRLLPMWLSDMEATRLVVVSDRNCLYPRWELEVNERVRARQTLPAVRGITPEAKAALLQRENDRLERIRERLRKSVARMEC